jgi:hypothetical protein
MIGLLSALLLVAPADESRSLYVPLQIEVCEHLKGAILYRDEQPLRALPGKQVLQFTYFPELQRIEPELERLRVVGKGFRAELVVTPSSVYVADKKIELDVEGQIARLRRHHDARHQTVMLSMICGDACSRTASSRSLH